MKLAEKWSSGEFDATPAQLAVFQKIQSARREPITLPCLCVMPNGQEYDCCTVRLYAELPTWRLEPNFRFIEPGMTFRKSPLTLPRALRLCTEQAEGYHHDFAPTVADAPGKRMVMLQGGELFFQHPLVRASDLNPSRTPYTDGLRDKLLESRHAYGPTLVGRRPKDAESLILPQAQ